MAYRATATRIDRDQALRERILDQALARVIAGGFAALTMQALADAVGIATGSLYRHFSNKGELAAEVFARASQREVDALAATLSAPGSAPQRLAAGVQQFAARAWYSRRLAYALIAEPVEPQVDEQRLGVQRHRVDRLYRGRAVLREGKGGLTVVAGTRKKKRRRKPAFLFRGLEELTSSLPACGASMPPTGQARRRRRSAR